MSSRAKYNSYNNWLFFLVVVEIAANDNISICVPHGTGVNIIILWNSKLFRIHLPAIDVVVVVVLFYLGHYNWYLSTGVVISSTRETIQMTILISIKQKSRIVCVAWIYRSMVKRFFFVSVCFFHRSLAGHLTLCS